MVGGGLGNVTSAPALAEEMATGRDMVNRVLYVEIDRSLRFETMPDK
jgi:hypothetical protein